MSDAPKEPSDAEKVEAFLRENQERLALWMRSNPGERPPVYVINGVCRWLTRQQRREVARRTQKARSRSVQGSSSRSIPSPSGKEHGPTRRNSNSDASPVEHPRAAGAEPRVE